MPWEGGLPRLSACDLLSRVVLEQLFLDADPRDWRLRYSSQITPITLGSYRQKVTYQLRLSRELIEAAMTEAGRVLGEDDAEIELVLPIDYLPKQLLLDFTLRGPDGKEAHLLHSAETTAWMTGIFTTAISTIDSRHGTTERPAVARSFFEKNERIIACLIASGQGEIGRRLEVIRPFSPVRPQPHEFVSSMLEHVEDAFRQFTGQPHLSRDLRIECEMATEVVFSALEDPRRRRLDKNEFHSPILNPLLLIADYMRRHFVADELVADAPDRCVRRFLLECYTFQRHMFQIVNEPVWPHIIMVLSQMTYFYAAMSRMKVPLDRDFTIELDHVIPMGDPPPRRGQRLAAAWRRLRYVGYQWYPFRFGDYRSIHIAVASEAPAELEQRPRKALVDVGRARVPAAMLFGRASHTAPDHSHFYTNKTAAEISQTLRVLELAKVMKAPAKTQAASGTVKSASADSLVVDGEMKSKDEEWTFGVDSKTSIKKGGKSITAADIKTGDSVQVRYSEEGGTAMAKSVRVDDDVLHEFKLGVRYRIEAGTLWSYRLITTVALFAFLYLVSVYDPESRDRGSFLPVVPLLFTFGGALASFRVQEAIVAARMKKYRLAVLMMSFGMAAYFMLGVLHPPCISGVRRFLEGSVWVRP